MIYRLVLFALVACSPSAARSAHGEGRPTTRAELASAVVAALRANDAEAIAGYYLTEADVGGACPKDAPHEYATYARTLARELRPRLKRELASCAALLPDWASATLKSTLGGEPRAPAVGCNALQICEDVVIAYDVGGRVVQIVLELPLRGEKLGYILTGKLTCKLAG